MSSTQFLFGPNEGRQIIEGKMCRKTQGKENPDVTHWTEFN